MNKKYHYIYLIKNIINKKRYVGKHSTSNLDDGYMGGGIYLNNAINKYGRKNFKREILEFCEKKRIEQEGNSMDSKFKYKIP